MTSVPTKIVRPGKFRKILHPFPPSGKVDLHIEASAPIDIYVIDDDDLGAFRAGKPVGGFKFSDREALDRRRLDLSSQLSGDDWYLILDNDSEEPVAVHYEVYY